MFSYFAAKETITITGVSGFVGSQMLNYCIKNFSDKFKIRGTVRDKENEIKMGPLQDYFTSEELEKVDFVSCDITDEAAVEKAIEGSTYVIHTASPVAVADPLDEEQIVTPAVQGALNVMKACSTHKVKRIVMTSSAQTVSAQVLDDEKDIYDEESWSNVEDQIKGFDAYAKGKTLAEKAAWDYLKDLSTETDAHKPELVTILPGFTVGSYITGGIASSPALIKAVMVNSLAGIPRLSFACVDIQDVVEAHFNALFTQEAAGQRFLVVSESLWLIDICNTLSEALKDDYDYEIADTELNRCPMYLIAWFSSDASNALEKWGHELHYDTTKSKEILKIEYKDVKKAVIETALSLIQAGAVEEKLAQK